MDTARQQTTLILVRHGETEGNVEKVWHGSLDAPLTARGKKQVSATASFLAHLVSEHPIDHFYVSPLPRAQSTAAAIAGAIDHEPVVDQALREFDLGDWEGRSFQELREQEGLWKIWAQDPSFAPPNGESPRTFNRRVVAALNQMAADHAGETVLAVTHGGVICNVLAEWLGDGPDDWRRWEPHNCAVSLVHQQNTGWTGELVNSIDHLPVSARVEEEEDVDY